MSQVKPVSDAPGVDSGSENDSLPDDLPKFDDIIGMPLMWNLIYLNLL